MEVAHKTSVRAGREDTGQSPQQILQTLHYFLSLSPHLQPHVGFPGKLPEDYRRLWNHSKGGAAAVHPTLQDSGEGKASWWRSFEQ